MGFLLLVLLFFASLFVLYAFQYHPQKVEAKKQAKFREEDIKYEESEAEKKGRSFEAELAEYAAEMLPESVIIKNCILNKLNKDGKLLYLKGVVASKEFDVIVLSKKGFLCIEAKNWNRAFVSGRMEDVNWIASYGKKKITVYSPFKQVTNGINTLKRYLPEFNFQRMVVFPNSTKVCSSLRHEQICDVTDYKNELKRMALGPDIISDKSVQLVKELLVAENEKARNMHADAKKAHITYVKTCVSECAGA